LRLDTGKNGRHGRGDNIRFTRAFRGRRFRANNGRRRTSITPMGFRSGLLRGWRKPGQKKREGFLAVGRSRKHSGATELKRDSDLGGAIADAVGGGNNVRNHSRGKRRNQNNLIFCGSGLIAAPVIGGAHFVRGDCGGCNERPPQSNILNAQTKPRAACGDLDVTTHNPCFLGKTKK